MADDAGQIHTCHKAFNFDLVIAALKQHYTNGHHTKAYRDIKAFMIDNGFSHRQGSGYRSDIPLTEVEVLLVVDKLYAAFPWFVHCINKFDVTDVGEVYDLAALYEEYNITPDTTPQPATKSILAELERYNRAQQDTPAIKKSKGRERPKKNDPEL